METKDKKQVVAALNKAANILVTVGVDPSVDELSSLLGLTLVLGKLDKHATAVFSGNVPPAISFLEPDKTFEGTVDGLRDFIIALNKDKADHLRYKLDGDVVKIFITPYKNTIIHDTDLQFSQGDFNVDLVVALGVGNKADLDTAVASHGRILHDATTISITNGSHKSELGEINWHADNASSLGEMLVSLSRDLGDSLIDEHIATAFMTGIVANTERFSNNLTTSDVMKTAAALMTLGANQQLIAARLEEAEEKPESAPAPVRAPESKPKAPAPRDEGGADGTMQIAHDETGVSLPPLPQAPSLEEVERQKEQILQQELNQVVPTAPPVTLNEIRDVKIDPQDNPDFVPQRRFIAKSTSYDDMAEPTMGGTLNATTERAEEDKRAQLEDERNRVILSHDAPPAETVDQLKAADAPHASEPVIPAPEVEPERASEPEPTAEPVAEPQREPIHVYEAPSEPEPEMEPVFPAAAEPIQTHPAPAVEEALATLGYPAGSHPTLAELDKKTGHTQPALEVDDARTAVANALDSVFNPGNNPVENIGSQSLGEEVHEVPVPVYTSAPASASTPEPVAVLPHIASAPVSAPTSTAITLPPLPPLPPLPGKEGELPLPPLPPLPEMGELDAHSSEREAPIDGGLTENDWTQHTVEPPTAHDPNQFHIPGQK